MDDIGPEEIMGLRAKERVIRRLAASGMSHPEIAWRFRCSPGHIDRTLRLTQVPRRGRDSTERRGPSALERVVAERGVAIGIVATPASVAQDVAGRLATAGVTSILNFAPTVLQVPAGVEVRRVDLSTELQILSFHLQQR